MVMSMSCKKLSFFRTAFAGTLFIALIPAGRLHAAPSLALPSSCQGASRCVAQVSAEKLNRAIAGMRAWRDVEQKQSVYGQSGLALLPLGGSILQPGNSANRANAYGQADAIYVLRRASHFVSLLFPELRVITVGDLSNDSGNTPSMTVGGTVIKRHPAGSHMGGKDFDVAYLKGGDGSHADGAIDFERSFWFTYAVLQSTGVDLVMSAHANVFRAWAAQAFEQKLINDIALSRFESPVLQLDDGYNHEHHMHVSVRNVHIGGRSMRFESSDDVYSCWLGMKRHNRGTGGDFCAAR